MAQNKKAGAKAPAKPKNVYFTVKDEAGKNVKFKLLGGPNKKYIFNGDTYSKEEAAKNEKLCAALVATGSPCIEKQ